MQKNNTIVIKIGTAVLSTQKGSLDVKILKSIVSQVYELIKMGYKVIIVSSGAIAAGIEAMGLKMRPKTLSGLQAAAAVGQGRLMKLYNDCMQNYNMHAAQVLLTRDDFSNRKRYLNIYNTLSELLNKYNAVPVINENDAVATDEIKFGDNDTLCALVANLAGAGQLFILTSVDGLYSGADNTVVPFVEKITPQIQAMATKEVGSLGAGGMQSKLQAVKMATAFGISCVIANGKTKDVILKIVKGEAIGTKFFPKDRKRTAKKRWLGLSLIPHGTIVVDDGAKKALISLGKSLLAAGILSAQGAFKAGDIVKIASLDGLEFARGVSNFSLKDINVIKGLKTPQIKGLLKQEAAKDEVVHRDNMVIL
ncbi:MAG: glutamate 5-kinase [Candidatus Omnitrophota bacterium]